MHDLAIIHPIYTLRKGLNSEVYNYIILNAIQFFVSFPLGLPWRGTQCISSFIHYLLAFHGNLYVTGQFEFEFDHLLCPLYHSSSSALTTDRPSKTDKTTCVRKCCLEKNDVSVAVGSMTGVIDDKQRQAPSFSYLFHNLTMMTVLRLQQQYQQISFSV